MMKKLMVVLAMIVMLVAVNANAQLYINEFMASNDFSIQDEYGENEDWIEIYNSAAAA